MVRRIRGKVDFALTNNTQRTVSSGDAGEDAANPRQPNPHGHIVSIVRSEGPSGPSRGLKAARYGGVCVFSTQSKR
jgi:secreted PhoX family phosphatase